MSRRLSRCAFAIPFVIGCSGLYVTASGGAIGQGSALSIPAPSTNTPAKPIEAQTPRYEFRLSLLEFSVLHGAAVNGISKYGGDADFALKMARQGEELVTMVTITNPRLLDVWTYWMAEKSTELLNYADVDKLEDNAKLALKTAQSLNAKLALAKQHPLYDLTTLAGRVVTEANNLRLDTEQGSAQLTGKLNDELAHWNHKSVLAAGYVKSTGVMEVARFVEYKPNTLELFVMSLCPFGKQAEYSIIHHLRELPSQSEAPKLEVRYLFYEQPPAAGPDGKPVEGAQPTYASLHGEKEIEEDLVQMLLRDSYPWVFFDYLLQRSASETPWPELVVKVGLGKDDVEILRDRIGRERDALIRAERDYCTKNYQITDGSPTYVWQSQVVPDIHTVRPFAKLAFSSPTCTAAH